ncbi:unnamed protein product [Caenorhabditis brenneri]
MTWLHLIALLPLIVLSNCDPNIFQLNKYSTGSTVTFDYVEHGAKLYLASNDDNSFLKNIEIISGGTITTLDTINGYTAGYTPMSLTITGGLSLRTTNNDTITNVLTGYLYVTTKEQADDPSFAVYVLKNRQAITTPDKKSTVVILNTELVTDSTDIDKPLKTSYVTAINQSPDTNMRFHWGFPAANWTNVTINQFFENPLYIDNYDFDGKLYNSTKAFFDNVEPLQIGLDCWYITTDGPAVAMILESKYVSNHVYTTTSVNATGLIVNSLIYKQHEVNFLLDYTRTRTVGTLISVFPISDDYISFYLSENNGGQIVQSYNKKTNIKHGLLTTYMQASKLTINSTSIFPGVFYCQYYGFTGDLVPVTSTVVQTSSTISSTSAVSTSTVVTTTKSSSTQSIIQILCITVAFVFFQMILI